MAGWLVAFSRCAHEHGPHRGPAWQGGKGDKSIKMENLFKAPRSANGRTSEARAMSLGREALWPWLLDCKEQEMGRNKSLKSAPRRKMGEFGI